MKFTKNQLFELTEAPGAELVERQDWRHGYKAVYVFPFEGKYYRVVIPVQSNEGWMLDGDTEGQEVKKVEVMSHKWVKVEL